MLATTQYYILPELLTWPKADALLKADYDTIFGQTCSVLFSPSRFSELVQYSQSRETHVILRLY
jgi:hypothetical protein